MKRGWILFYSVVVVVLIVAGPISGALISAHYFKGFARVLQLPYIKVFIMCGSITVASLVSLIVVYYKWAPNNLFFTFVPEGRAKAVVSGDAFKKILLQWKGYTLSEAKSNDGTIDIGDVIDEAAPRKRILGGLRFYGAWPFDDMYLYNFGWTDILENGKSQPHPEKLIDYIVLKTTLYYIKVENAEDKGKMPLDVELVLKVRITNPYKALFRAQNWLEILVNITGTAVTHIITLKSYDKWIAEKEDLGKEILRNLTEDGLIEEFKDSYGVSLLSLGVKDINPSGKFRDITVKKVTAEKEKEAVKVRAEAEKLRIKTVYTAITDFGDSGRLIRGYEAMEESSRKGAGWIVAAPNLAPPTLLIDGSKKGKETSDKEDRRNKTKEGDIVNPEEDSKGDA